ncbi:MAG: NTP transferase domain-containing protein [Myxococcota bacterium]|nr:NTP transferase domain-containing protein [Myxococcota bacterium]
MNSVTGIILAAGGSSRMGHPKALLDLDGAPLIRHHINQFSRVCDRIVVVTGRHRAEIEAVLPPEVVAIHNPSWHQTGPAESLLLALREPSTRAVVTPVDVPPVPSAVLDALLAVSGAAVPQWQGRDGHPVVIDRRARAVLAAGGVLRDALVDAQRVAVEWPDATANLNRPEQWSAWLRARDQRR